MRLFAVLVAWAAPLAAAPVDVRVTLATPAGLASGTALRLVATRAGYAGATASPAADASERESTAELTARGALLRLAPGLWTLDARGESWWVASRDIFVEQQALEISLSAWPAGTVSGRVTLPAGDAAPEFVTLEFESPPAARGEGDARPVPRSRVRCPVVDAAWRCAIPAAPLDLRVEAGGFVPHYFWDSTCAPGKTSDLGALALRRGASVVGWVKHADGRAASGAQVAIADATQQPIVADARVPGPPQPAFSATADARGFFQITGVPLADALVVASLTGMASDHTAIRPLPDRELRLLSPLVLAPPAALDVELDPPIGPGGKHWTLDVIAQPPPGSARARKLVEGGRRAGPRCARRLCARAGRRQVKHAAFALLAPLALPAAAGTLPPGYTSAQAQGQTVVFVRPRAADAPRERAAIEVALHACAREAQEQLAPDVRVLELSAPAEVRAVGSTGEPLPSRLLVNGAFYGAVFFWDAKKPDVHEQLLDCAETLTRAHSYFREPANSRSPQR